MSRIGKKTHPVPAGVEVDIRPGTVSVKGPKGALEERISPDITVVAEDGVLRVSRPSDRSDHRALHGLTRSLVANMVTGVTDGYERRLEIQGVGYRAALRGPIWRCSSASAIRSRWLPPRDHLRRAGTHAGHRARDLQAARR